MAFSVARKSIQGTAFPGVERYALLIITSWTWISI
jgi:hypothetical protein